VSIDDFHDARVCPRLTVSIDDFHDARVCPQLMPIIFGLGLGS